MVRPEKKAGADQLEAPVAPALDLEALAGDVRLADAAAAGAEDGIGAPGSEGAPAALGMSPAQGWAQVPATFGMVLSLAFPEIEAIYTEQRCLEWGEKMVPVAARYGWTADKFFEWLGPWVGLAIATGKLAKPTYAALAARVEAAKKARAAQQEQQTEQPAQ